MIGSKMKKSNVVKHQEDSLAQSIKEKKNFFKSIDLKIIS